MNDVERRWNVLLIAGAGGTGKTELAETLGRRLGMPWLQVDDVRLALQRVTTADQLPALHFFTATADIWRRSPEELRDRLIGVGEVVSQALSVVIAHHVATAKPLIIEGDGILPQLAAMSNNGARFVVVFEHDEDAIWRDMRARGRGFDAQPIEVQQSQVRLNLLFGRWLRDHAEQLGLPLVAVRPHASLANRVLDVTGS